MKLSGTGCVVGRQRGMCFGTRVPKAHRRASAITITGTAAWTNLACDFLEVNVGHYII